MSDNDLGYIKGLLMSKYLAKAILEDYASTISKITGEEKTEIISRIKKDADRLQQEGLLTLELNRNTPK